MMKRSTIALRAFPTVRQRFMAGLPPHHLFSVTTRLRDSLGHFEQVFVNVDSIRKDTVFGRLNSDIALVVGFHNGQVYSLPIARVLDWTIVRPDGTEEGNYIGKFADSLQDRLQHGRVPKPC